jgi:hypothetical protein
MYRTKKLLSSGLLQTLRRNMMLPSSGWKSNSRVENSDTYKYGKVKEGLSVDEKETVAISKKNIYISRIFVLLPDNHYHTKYFISFLSSLIL